jgi:hypothetical protein
MSTWVVISLIWFVTGLICWAVILRFFPPIPLIDPRSRDSIAEKQVPRPFSVRDLPVMVMLSVPIAAFSPPLLIAFICIQICKRGHR